VKGLLPARSSRTSACAGSVTTTNNRNMELDGALAQLSNDCRDFWAQNNGRVTRLASPPQPTTFQREYVQKSKPVVVAGAFTEWRCMKKWSLEYLASQNGDALVTVNATPDGRADSVKWCQLPEDTASRKVSAVRDSSDSTGASDPVRLFVLPEERQMTMRGFKAALTDCNSPQAKALGPNGVPYLSRQNDSLRAEFSAVADDVPSSGPAFAVGAFGECTAATSEGTNGSSGFEAVNLWVGDGRSVTSTHQDPYENLYCVLRGTKRFTLLPPCDAPFVNEQPFRQGQHRLKSLRASSVSGSKAAAAGILSTSTSISSSGIANSSSSTRHQTCAEDSVGVDASNGSEDGAGEWVVDILDGALNWVDALDEDSAGTSGHGTVGSGSNSNHSSITSRLVKHVSGSERKTSALVDALAASRTGQRATPVVVEVHAGECLYLPAMWYHRVEQVAS